MSEKLPVRYDITAGTLSFLSGTYRGKSLMLWDAVNDCNGSECPVYNRCPFDRKDLDREIRCAIQLKYVKTLTNMVLKNHIDNMDDSQLWCFGMQVLPLASHLVKLKLIENSLGLAGIFNYTKKGVIVTHPVYREIRETIKALNQACQNAAIDPRTLNAKKLKPSDLTEEQINDIYEVESDYYDRMMKTEQDYKKLEGNANSQLSYNHDKDVEKKFEDEDEEFI